MPRFLTAFMLLAASFAQGAVIYSGIQDISVPFSPDGVYLNIATGATTTSQPGDWNVAPWINPFFGGTILATDSLLRPVITGADQVVNLPSGTMVDASSAFASGESGSVSHVGTGSNQFQLGTPGYIGFVFETSPGGVSHYGWLNLVIRNGDAGTIHDWAWAQRSRLEMMELFLNLHARFCSGSDCCGYFAAHQHGGRHRIV